MSSSYNKISRTKITKVKKLLNLQKRVICSSIHFFGAAWLAPGLHVP